jgi:hypothetical protein
MEDELLALEDELGRNDDGDLASLAGGYKMAEASTRDEPAPLILAEPAVNLCDVHA